MIWVYNSWEGGCPLKLRILLQQIRIRTGKEILWASYICLCKRAATNQIIHSKVPEFMCLSLHAYLKFTQGIKVFKDAEQHHDEMLI